MPRPHDDSIEPNPDAVTPEGLPLLEGEDDDADAAAAALDDLTIALELLTDTIVPTLERLATLEGTLKRLAVGVERVARVTLQ